MYVFGGSSPLFPEGRNFPLHLQKLARQKKLPLSVVNFSYYGLNSFDLEKRVRTALAWRVPDLVLIYSGHNDYSFCYWNHLLPNFYLVKGAPILEFATGAALEIFKLLDVFDDDRLTMEEGAVRIALFEPALLGWAQRYGLLSLSRELFQQVDQKVEAHFQKNLARIISVTEAANVPVVLMTTLSNLHHPPVGIDGDAEEFFEAGGGGDPDAQHAPLMLQARGAGRVTGFVRAHAPLPEDLRSLPGKATK
ncbi:hypothetical protein H8E07_00280, partial [bacterium]|nr:hypothetical protein [bacterium]